MKNYHVKKNDKVVVIAGAYKGEEAVISAVITKNDRVVLDFTEKKDRQIGKRTLRKSRIAVLHQFTQVHEHGAGGDAHGLPHVGPS